MEDLNKLSAKISEAKDRAKTPEYNKKNQVSAIAVSSEIAGAVIFAFIVGFFLDKYFDHRFAFKVTFMLISVAASFYNIYKYYIKNE